MKVLNYLKFILPILVIGICFSSCSKEDTNTSTLLEDIDEALIDDIINKNELGVFQRNSMCDCYGPFENIDWENLTEQEIENQVEAALASMTEEELIALFTPVCADGIYFENACTAECEGITSYENCFDEEWDEDWENEWDDEWDNEWGCDFSSLEFLGCYELQFPVTVVFEDGSAVEINDSDQFFETILFANEESPELVYPFTLVHYDTEEVVTLTSDAELAGLSLDCFDVPFEGPFGGSGGSEIGCVVDNFPTTLIVNGNPFTVNSEEEFGEIFEEIFGNNPSEIDFNIELGFPTTLTFDSGEVVVVNSQDEYFEALVEYCP